MTDGILNKKKINSPVTSWNHNDVSHNNRIYLKENECDQSSEQTLEMLINYSNNYMRYHWQNEYDQ